MAISKPLCHFFNPNPNVLRTRPDMKIEHLSGVRILRVDLAAIFGAKDVTLYLTYARVELAPCALHLWHRLFRPSIGAKKERWPASIGSLPGALQVAAPSMKAALEAGRSEDNLFHQGFAKEADDPAIIAATMTKPSAVMRRAVGSKARFSEYAGFPADLSAVEIKA